MKNYEVGLWPGYGYLLDTFDVKAECEEDALDKVVAEVVNNNLNAYFEEDGSDFIKEMLDEYEEAEGWIYIDATMEGADRPVWISDQFKIYDKDSYEYKSRVLLRL